MSTLEAAIALAVKAHEGQLDKAGRPYILHPLRVMFSMESEVDQIVAILHDVVEDTDVTFDNLRGLGYGEEIIEALDGVTRRDEETYETFVERSLAHPISRRVKLADLEDNMDVRRMPPTLSERDLVRLQRYRKAWERLHRHQ